MPPLALKESMTGKTRSLPLTHLLLAVAVAGVWGTNFVVIKVALAHLPPLLFAALRFVLAFLPAAFFFKRPAVRWTNLAVYGVVIGAGQFGLLYIAMQNDISPGLAPIVIQMQVFSLLVPVFGMSTSALLLSEPMPAWKLIAAGLVMSGLALNLVWPVVVGRTKRYATPDANSRETP
jgi:O-acetylserine/cysteine efflux transporter